MSDIVLIAFVIGISVAGYILKSFIQKLLNRKEEIIKTKMLGIPFAKIVALANGLTILFSVAIYLTSSDSGIAAFLVPACVIYTINIVIIFSENLSQTVIYRIARPIATIGNEVMAVALVLFGALGGALSGRDIFKVLAILGVFGVTVALNMFLLAKEAKVKS